jgi:hypothetical protein
MQKAKNGKKMDKMKKENQSKELSVNSSWNQSLN